MYHFFHKYKATAYVIIINSELMRLFGIDEVAWVLYGSTGCGVLAGQRGTGAACEVCSACYRSWREGPQQTCPEQNWPQQHL